MTLTSPLLWLLCALLYAGNPLADYDYDRRESDGYRYDVYCVGLYQRPETMRCVEVPVTRKDSNQ